MSNAEYIKVLFIEDSYFLTESFVNCVKEEEMSCKPLVSIQVTVARHIEDAVKNLENNQFDVILLDIMLPRDEKTLNYLEKIETERKSLMKELLNNNSIEEKVGELTNSVAKIRMRIDEIDDIIDNDIQDVEGGYNILCQYLEKQNMKQYDYPVIFISARGQPELKEKCKRIVKDGKFAWIEKPISEIDILKRLLKFCYIEYVEK